MKILVKSRVGHETHYDFAEEVTIGREVKADAAIILNHSQVSREHARIFRQNGDYVLQDLGSTNGTLLNGESVTEVTSIVENDVIKIHHFELVFLADKVIDTLEPEIHGQLIETETDPPGHSIHSKFPFEQYGTDRTEKYFQAIVDLGAKLMEGTDISMLSKVIIDRLLELIPLAVRGGVVRFADEALEDMEITYVNPNALATISKRLSKQAITGRKAFIFQSEDELGSIRDLNILSAIYAPLFWEDTVLGVIYIDNPETKTGFTRDDLHLVMSMARQMAMFLQINSLHQQRVQLEKVRANFERQFSPAVAEMLATHGNELELGGKHVHQATILISDIRGFTAQSRDMQPTEVMRNLNTIFEKLTPIVFEYDGIVDKYVGDAIIAVFGAPIGEEEKRNNQCEKAVKAAIKMQQTMQEIDTPYEIGIGIHTGAIVQGFLGSMDKMEFTVIGDTVNKASRYCDGASKNEITISDLVYNQISTMQDKTYATDPILTKHTSTEAPLPCFKVLWQDANKE